MRTVSVCMRKGILWNVPAYEPYALRVTLLLEMFNKSSIHLWTRLVLPNHVGEVAVLNPGPKRRCIERVGDHLEAHIDLSSLYTARLTKADSHYSSLHPHPARSARSAQYEKDARQTITEYHDAHVGELM